MVNNAHFKRGAGPWRQHGDIILTCWCVISENRDLEDRSWVSGSNLTNERRNHVTVSQSNTEPSEPSEPSEHVGSMLNLPLHSVLVWETWRSLSVYLRPNQITSRSRNDVNIMERSAARGCRSNEHIYLQSRRARTPSARAPNIDQRRRQSPAAQRSNSILSEECRRNYRAAAERTDQLDSRLLIADNHRMKNGRKSSGRR